MSINYRQVANDIGNQLENHTFVESYNVQDTCKILELATLNVSQAINLFEDSYFKYDPIDSFKIFQYAKVELSHDYDEVVQLCSVLSNFLKAPVMKSLHSTVKDMADSISAKDTQLVQLRKEINDMKGKNPNLLSRKSISTANVEIAKQQETIEALKNEIEMLKEQSINSAPVTNMIHIENLKQFMGVRDEFERTNEYVKEEDFYKVYDILRNIADEGDRVSMKYAVENRFHEIRRGFNMFLYAASKGNLPLVKLLAECGADIACTNTINKWTALHHACYWDRLPVVQYLVTLNGLDIYAKNIGGDTALHKACDHCRVEIVKFLTTVKGIKLSEKNNKGKTPLHSTNNNEIKTHLRNLGAT